MSKSKAQILREKEEKRKQGDAKRQDRKRGEAVRASSQGGR